MNNIEIMDCNFSEAIEQLGKRKERVDFLISQGIKQKEKLVTEKYSLIQRGYVFLTGSNEVERLKRIKKLKKYIWHINKLPEKENFFMIILKKV